MEHMHRSTEAAAVDLLEAFLHDVLSQESGWDEWTWEKRNPLFQHIPAVFGCIGDPMGGYIWGPEVWDPPSFLFGDLERCSTETRCLWQSLVPCGNLT